MSAWPRRLRASSASASSRAGCHAGPSPEWSAPLRAEFFDALAEDFNTPRALAAAFDWVREANRVGRAGG